MLVWYMQEKKGAAAAAPAPVKEIKEDMNEATGDAEELAENEAADDVAELPEINPASAVVPEKKSGAGKKGKK